MWLARLVLVAHHTLPQSTTTNHNPPHFTIPRNKDRPTTANDNNKNHPGFGCNDGIGFGKILLASNDKIRWSTNNNNNAWLTNIMFGGSNAKIEFPVEKSLLHEVEKQDVPRDQIVLKDLCDSNIAAFGEPGSDLRRDIQEHWNNARRKKIRSYKQYLKRCGVTPSLTTYWVIAKKNVGYRLTANGNGSIRNAFNLAVDCQLVSLQISFTDHLSLGAVDSESLLSSSSSSSTVLTLILSFPPEGFSSSPEGAGAGELWGRLPLLCEGQEMSQGIAGIL